MLSTSWINAAAAMPIITAMAIIQGISSIEFMVSAGTLNAGSEPYTTWVTMAALTAARMMGVNPAMVYSIITTSMARSEEHTSELQSRPHLVCRLLLEKK